jgi:hypothetical protein
VSIAHRCPTLPAKVNKGKSCNVQNQNWSSVTSRISFKWFAKMEL